MSGKKIVLMVLVILVMFGAVAAGLMWHGEHYVMVDFKFYPKDAAVLDLRDEEISAGQYEKIRLRLPDCDVQWNVPLSTGSYPKDAKTVTLDSLSDSDVKMLDYLTELETVHAEGCTDYTQLLALQQHRPEVDVRYTVALGEETYDCGVTGLDIKNMTAEEISLLGYLPALETVICSGGEEAVIAQLQEYCHKNALAFGVNIGGLAIMDTVTDVSTGAVTEEELTLLQFLPDLEQLYMEEPAASAESLVQLRQKCPDVDIRWEKTVDGVTYTTEAEEIDLSKEKIRDLDQVTRIMAYFPDAETVFLGESSLKNEKLAQFRDEVRQDYKVVWTVKLGNKLKARTDDTTFMPVRERVYYFNDEEAYNLRYCEDMVCIDIGHMSITDIEFVKYMPNLTYLVLAHTQLQYIEPIRSCKNLKFLELDWSPIKDYSPLVDCTGLEDLNLGNTYADSTPIGTMTWLKNLWMIGCSTGAKYRMTQALTDTRVMTYGSATVASGWRNLDNYYAMRDLLGMEYMSW